MQIGFLSFSSRAADTPSPGVRGWWSEGRLRPRQIPLRRTRHPGPSLVTQVLSGITVSLAMVPESLAFTFVAGVSPIVGLHAAALMGLTTAVLGAQPGVISGAAGATAVVFAPLVASHGVEYLFAAVALAGFMQLVAGALRLGKFIRLVPQPCMIGFVNGLAIVIGAAQLEAFRGLTGEALYVQMGLAAFTIALIRLLPEVPFIPKQIPSPLAAVMACAGLVRYLGVSAKTVGDVAPVSGALPSFHLPAVPATWDTFTLLAPVAASVAAVGLIETLLTQQLVDDVTERRTSTHREVMAQGAANLLNGVFGGMGGCAMIGQSMLNVESGGRTRVAGLTCGAAILGYVTFGSAFIEGVPIAALAGTMLSLVFDIFDWTSFARVRKIPKTDAVVIALVTGVTVACNLAVAVFAGVVLSALGFAWKSSRRIEAPRTTDANFGGPTTAVYRLAGPLFSALREVSSSGWTPKTKNSPTSWWISPARRCGTAARSSPSTISRANIETRERRYACDTSRGTAPRCSNARAISSRWTPRRIPSTQSPRITARTRSSPRPRRRREAVRG